MSDAADDTDVEGIVWRRLLAWFSRLLALGLMFRGLAGWAALIGLPLLDGRAFLDLTLPQRSATVAFAVGDLVAAVGLWLLTAWGAVVWLAVAGARIALDTLFGRTFGSRPIEAAVLGSIALVHIALIVLAWRQERTRR